MMASNWNISLVGVDPGKVALVVISEFACAHLISWLRATIAAGGLVAAVEHVGDVVDLLGSRGGVAGGGPQVNVPESGGDGVHGHAGLEAVGGPVGA